HRAYLFPSHSAHNLRHSSSHHFQKVYRARHLIVLRSPLVKEYCHSSCSSPPFNVSIIWTAIRFRICPGCAVNFGKCPTRTVNGSSTPLLSAIKSPCCKFKNSWMEIVV